jgi:hypothetical protein
MSRDLTPSMTTEVGKAELRPFLLFEGDFATGTVRAWSGIGPLIWDGRTWQGTGTLLSITDVYEDAEISAKGISATLNGIPSELISLALQSCRQGSLGRVYLGFFDDSNNIIADPILLFEGKLDIPVIDEEGETSSISISYESRLIDLERPRESRYTDEDQKREFPGDLGCAFVVALQDKNIVWGGT